MKGNLKIKVCGMKDPANLQELCGLEPDYVGFIFYPSSPRYVGKDVDEGLFRIPGNKIPRVGVFVNAEIEEIYSFWKKGLLDLVQLHGKEHPEYCRELHRRGVRLVKAFHPDMLKSPGVLEEYDMLDFVLVDSPTPDFGGSGKKFSWEVLDESSFPAPLMLSGGLGPDDVEEIGSIAHPDLFAIDLNSRFETGPGLKDIALLRDFIKKMRK